MISTDYASPRIRLESELLDKELEHIQAVLIRLHAQPHLLNQEIFRDSAKKEMGSDCAHFEYRFLSRLLKYPVITFITSDKVIQINTAVLAFDCALVRNSILFWEGKNEIHLPYWKQIDLEMIYYSLHLRITKTISNEHLAQVISLADYLGSETLRMLYFKQLQDHVCNHILENTAHAQEIFNILNWYPIDLPIELMDLLDKKISHYICRKFHKGAPYSEAFHKNLEKMQSLSIPIILHLSECHLTKSKLLLLRNIPLKGLNLKDSFIKKKDLLQALAQYTNRHTLSYCSLENVKTIDNQTIIKLCQHFPNIDRLELGYCIHVGDEAMKGIETLPLLHTLDLSGTQITNKGTAQIPCKLNTLILKDCSKITELASAKLHSMNHLLELSLINTFISEKTLQKLPSTLKCLQINSPCKISDQAASNIAKMTRLQHLEIDGLKKSEKLLKNLPLDLYQLSLPHCESISGAASRYLKQLSNLYRLNLSWMPLTDQIIQNLPPHIQILDLSHCQNLSEDMLSCLTNMSDLIELRLQNTAISDAGVGFLPTHLQILNLSACRQLSNQACQRLNTMTALKTLYLDGCNIDDRGLSLLPLSLYHLTLSYLSHVSDASCTHIHKMNKLVALDLSGTSVSNMGISKLPSQLQELRLAHCPQVTAGLIESIKPLVFLKKLSLDGCAIDNATIFSLPHALTELSLVGCKEITDLAFKSNRRFPLESLNLTQTKVSSRILHYLSKTIKLLWLKECAFLDDGLSEELPQFSRLEFLSLEGVPITNKILSCLPRHLHILDIGKTGITDEGLKHISRYKSLIKLSLAHTKVSDSGIHHLPSKIQELYLRFTSISDRGLKTLSKLKDLTLLDLANTSITDEGLRFLSPKLQILNLSNCERITDLSCEFLLSLKYLQQVYLINTQVSNETLRKLQNKGLIS